jgi:cobalt transporter subunit CbtB
MTASTATFATRTATRAATISVNLMVQIAVLLLLTGVVIWTLLFSGIPNLHDPVHALRHALYMIPCH